MDYDFSIIIPYYQKDYEINLVLKSFVVQKYDKNKFEIIIIDDGSDNKIDSIINKYSNYLNISYHYISHTGNRGKNRNIGAKFAKAARLIFLDSDVVVGNKLLHHFDIATRNNKKIISLGKRTDLLKFDKTFINEYIIENNIELFDNLPAENDLRTMALNYMRDTGTEWTGNWQLFYSHCFCIWKESFDEADGFDENFTGWGAEDIELGYRLYKAGSKIIFNNKTKSYHLHHNIDFVKIINSLRKNYQYFIQKHNDWEIELFIKELECWAVQTIIFQEEIKKKKHIVNTLKNIDDIIQSIPDKTLLVGIDIKTLIESEKVEAAFIPESQNDSNKIYNIIGIFTEYKKEHFNLAIISEEYKKINQAMFAVIFEKISSISKEVIIVSNNDNIIINANNSINNIKKERKKFITFSLENDINHNLNKYWFVNLAIATQKIGIITGIELAYDPRNEIDINKGYLYFTNKEKINLLKQIYLTENNFIGDAMPSIMESDMVVFSNRAVGQRIFWEEQLYLNYEIFINEKRLNAYDKLLLKHKWEMNLYPDNIKKNFLPVGIDAEKINKIKSNKNNKNNKFTFLWSEQYSSPFTNLDMLLTSFCELFNNIKDVQIKIIIPNNYKKHYRSEYYNNTMNKMLINSVNYTKLSCELYMKKIIKKYSNIENIIFISNNNSDEDCSEELYKCDCFIDIDSTKKIHPLLLESIAFGKKKIIIDDNRYEDYIPDDLTYRIKYKKKSALYEFGKIENPILDNVDFNRYYLINQPIKESIKLALLNAYNDRKYNEINNDFINDFSKKYNWLSIADRLKNIIYQ